MRLEDAIQHLQETLSDSSHDWGCAECKAEHEQLLTWLIDYQSMLNERNDVKMTYKRELATVEQILTITENQLKSMRIPRIIDGYGITYKVSLSETIHSHITITLTAERDEALPRIQIDDVKPLPKLTVSETIKIAKIALNYGDVDVIMEYIGKVGRVATLLLKMLINDIEFPELVYRRYDIPLEKSLIKPVGKDNA